MQFIIFFTIVLTVYFSANYYIFYHGLKALPEEGLIRRVYVWGFWIVASMYFAGRIIERVQISYFSDALVWIGSFWLGALFYFFFIVLLLDIVRLVNGVLPFFPGSIIENYQRVKMITMGTSIILVAGILIYGFINARNPIVKKVDIAVAKSANGLQSINAVLVSDIHLGTIIGKNFLNRVINEIEDLKPDIVFIAGDILDEDLEPVIRQNLAEKLKRLTAPMGVYAVLGNHEYIGGADEAFDYLASNGMIILKDSVVKIDDSFYIIGRDDNESDRFGAEPRKPLKELINIIENPSLPLILIDHQPLYLKEAADLGIDIQFSGHTHKGQLWPLNYLINLIYKVGYGYGIIDNMQVYVSSGIGTWGPPLRIGSRPEIVNVNISFNSKGALEPTQ